ncbi:MAG: ribose-5-phosphate isomerase RpiA [Candidatus Micrarchaeota archaeon]
MHGKENAARAALGMVRAGTTLGLGTGSTAEVFIRMLAERNRRKNMHLKCVATSKASERLAKKMGLKVAGLDKVGKIDLAVDGADQVDRRLNLIKGGGGAHAREKVVGYAAGKFVVIVDESKLCTVLHGKIPLEILPFAFPLVKRVVGLQFGAKVVARDVKSDNGNVLADAFFGRVPDPRDLESWLDGVPGVVANGLFTKNVHSVIVGTAKGARVMGR